MKHRHARSADQRGVATVLLLFAMSAFSVLGIAGVTTGLGEPGKTFPLFRGTQEGNLTKFVAPIVVPNSWRVQRGDGSYRFKLPLIVPEQTNDGESTAAWHTMTEAEIPGVSVCCESRPGVCAQRAAQTGSPVVDWTPQSHDSQLVSVTLTSQSNVKEKADLISAAITDGTEQAAREMEPIACQLEYQGTVIAKGLAYLRQTPRADGSSIPTDVVEGRMELALRIQ